MKMNLNRKNSGFTLIELLVVVAIIGILASVVLASLNSARSKGGDAAVKSNLANARSQAELFFYSNGNKYNAGSSLTDICDPAASVGTPATKGIFEFVDNARVAAGVAGSVNIDYNVAGATNVATCHSNPTGSAWAAEAPLKAGGMFCVDSTGKAKEEVAALAATVVVCS